MVHRARAFRQQVKIWDQRQNTSGPYQNQVFNIALPAFRPFNQPDQTDTSKKGRCSGPDIEIGESAVGETQNRKRDEENGRRGVRNRSQAIFRLIADGWSLS